MEQRTKKTSIKNKIIASTSLTIMLTLVFLGAVIVAQISFINKRQYSEKLTNTISVMDSAIQTYFSGLEGSIKYFSNTHLIQQLDDGITSYVHLKDPNGKGGKIPMDKNKFSGYEADVYREIETFTQDQSGVLDMSLSLESNGAYISYPTSARSEGYDPRGRSWYKAAKAKPGIVDFSDAYEASDGTKSIVLSLYFNGLDGKGRGVASMDANLNILNEICSSKDAETSQKFILVDRNGTILLDQIDRKKEFTAIKEREIKGLENWENGKNLSYTAKVQGKKCKINTFSSKNSFVPLNYICITLASEVNIVNNTVFRSTACAVLVALVVCFFVMMFVSHSITKPLVKAISVLKDISEGDGDLTSRIPVVSHDETMQMSNYFNNTLSKLDDSMKAVLTESNVMKDVAKDLSTNIGETSSAINEITENISSIKDKVSRQSQGIESTTKSMNDITENIENLNASIDDHSKSVTQSSSAMEEMAANIKSVNEIFAKNAIEVNELLKKAESGLEEVNKSAKINSEITAQSEALMEAATIIQDIAEQTNLLAMNAAIEAAHAGEAGKGFAVVASEIRSLSENSGTQSKKISSDLNALKEKISLINASSKDLIDHFNLIYEGTKKIQDQEMTMQNAMSEQTIASSSALDSMENLKNISEGIKESSLVMTKNCEEVTDVMNKLSAFTSEITTGVTELTNGVVDLNNAMQNINDKTKDNDSSIEKLVQEMSKFKV